MTFVTRGARDTHGVAWLIDGGVGCWIIDRKALEALLANATPTSTTVMAIDRRTVAARWPSGVAATSSGSIITTSGCVTTANPNSQPQARHFPFRTATTA